MAEPTSAAGAAGAAGAQWWPWVVGLLSAFLANIGVPWEALFWAAAGAFFGAGFAPKTGRWRAIAGFPLSVLLAAKAGVIFAHWHGPLGNLLPSSTAEAAAALCGLIFHPAVSTMVRLVPVLARLRLGVDPKDASP